MYPLCMFITVEPKEKAVCRMVMMIVLLIVLFHETNFVYLWGGYGLQALDALSPGPGIEPKAPGWEQTSCPPSHQGSGAHPGRG